MIRILSAIAATFVVALGSANAAPIGLAGGTTVIQLAVDVQTAFGLTPGVDGGALLINPNPVTVEIPITGGSLNFTDLSGRIEHDGSGITLSDGATTVLASDFVIDTARQFVEGDISIDGVPVSTLQNADLFRFDVSELGSIPSEILPPLTALDAPSLSLLISSDLALGLATAFNDDGLLALEDELLAFAATAPQVVPLPGALGLFVLGAGGLAAARRRKSVTGA